MPDVIEIRHQLSAIELKLFTNPPEEVILREVLWMLRELKHVDADYTRYGMTIVLMVEKT